MTAQALDSIREQLMNRRYEPNVAVVNELADSLRELKPGSEVSYVDPIHDVNECRIVSLFSSTGETPDGGFITPGDDAAVARMLGLQWQLGLRPEFVMPWNVHPWFTPGEPQSKLTPEQIQAGLKPLLRLLVLIPRASVIVAHGTEANRLAGLLLKTENQLIWRRGLKTYKVRALGGRSFAGTPARQEQYLEEMRSVYADAMARTGLNPVTR
ncbi:uracil-DNA glycosylase [Pseudarthrobacter sp. J1763]|uniref:uracil-DNA glycosylase n=1 Tax=Pseudarthrobacter sp. J1763 TaxID=3420445 RepID=UPI003D2D2120